MDSPATFERIQFIGLEEHLTAWNLQLAINDFLRNHVETLVDVQIKYIKNEDSLSPLNHLFATIRYVPIIKDKAVRFC